MRRKRPRPKQIPGPDRPVSRQTSEFSRVLVEPWSVTWWPDRNCRHTLRLPAGTTYYPSVPVLTAPRLNVPAAAHDPLYDLQGQVKGYIFTSQGDPVRHVPRRYADRLLYRLALRVGAPQWQAWAAYVAVRCLGRPAWSDTPSSQVPAV